MLKILKQTDARIKLSYDELLQRALNPLEGQEL